MDLKKLLGEFFVTGDVMIYAADVLIVMTLAGIVFLLTYFKKWNWLWKEWLTTVDHKKIGIMYILTAVAMMFRAGIDALMIRSQLSFSGKTLQFLDPEHYNEIFTTHGTIMIFFMAMPFLIGLMNIAVPLQIGSRDVAFPYINALSFWTLFFGAMLFNISFVIGGSPNAGWTNYAPMAEAALNPGVGQNFYLLGLQLSGIGTLATGINFIVTIVKMRAPGMKFMRMPMFTWSTLITSVLIVTAFPILTVALGQMTFDRLFGSHFFTLSAEGMPMLWANLFWLWGHPEVYIVVLPAFGIFSEIIATFSRKRLFGYPVMVWSIAIIALLSFLVWVHHFFTMGAGPMVNSFFSISTMLIAIPTGVKIFNWLGTMYRGRLRFSLPMLWSLAFIPCFVIGGVTGVMLSMAAADYQYHNSYFLIAHFHYVLISGTVFASFAGFHFWYPKMFGHMLNEKIGIWSFWLFVIGFNACFLPMYALGLMGMPRRIYTYPASSGWEIWNLVATMGAFLMGAGFAILVFNIVYSMRYGKRDRTGDPWDGRTLEWATPTPVPEYNFAKIPQVTGIDDYWYKKQNAKDKDVRDVDEEELEPIYMPNSSYRPFTIALLLFIAFFAAAFQWYWLAIAGLAGIAVCMILRSFEFNKGHYLSVEEIKKAERAAKNRREGK